MLNINKKGIATAVVGTLIASTAILSISTQQASAADTVAIARAMNTPTTLTFWSWLPGQANEVKLFTAKYPKIKVNLVNVGSGGT